MDDVHWNCWQVSGRERDILEVTPDEVHTDSVCIARRVMGAITMPPNTLYSSTQSILPIQRSSSKTHQHYQTCRSPPYSSMKNLHKNAEKNVDEYLLLCWECLEWPDPRCFGTISPSAVPVCPQYRSVSRYCRPNAFESCLRSAIRPKKPYLHRAPYWKCLLEG